MMPNFYAKIIVTIFFLVLLPDFILSLGGRDTYLFYHYPALVNVGRVVIIIACVLCLIEIISLFFKKKWIMAISFCTGILLFFGVSKCSINVLIDKSVLEAHHEVGEFFINKGFNYTGAVKIEDDVVIFYDRYMMSDFSEKNLQLLWKSPQLGKYEFRVSTTNTQPFLVRLSTLQNKPNKIWIHSE